jgi:hypothetical protein
MKGLLFTIGFFICISISAQQNAITDGPYIFYQADSISIESIHEDIIKKEVFKNTLKPSSIKVALPGTVGSFFNVPLKQQIHIPATDYKKSDKIFALSDIEGNFHGLYKLLLAGGVIDEQLNWKYDNGHLVICGDIMDRGEEVTASLWLLYKLEEEAKSKGGFVHVILGNHEIMNLSEDIRYVHPKYIEVSKRLERDYNELYAANTELGRWLRSKNIMEKIGNSLFLHAGVSEAINSAGHSLKKLNNLARPYYDQDGFDSILIKARVTTIFNSNTSPFWYRGYFVNPTASLSQVQSTLSKFNVKRIIVGHTLVENIKKLYNGYVIAVDVNHHEGNHQALLIENDALYRVTSKGEKHKVD